MQEWFTCEPGHEAEASVHQDKVCASVLKNMFYEAHIQCMIDYYAEVRHEKLDKKDARQMMQSPETDMPYEHYLLVSRKQ